MDLSIVMFVYQRVHKIWVELMKITNGDGLDGLLIALFLWVKQCHVYHP